jgi:mevalonate kinase
MLRKSGGSVFDEEFNEEALLEMYANDDTTKIQKFHAEVEKVKTDFNKLDSVYNKHLTHFDQLSREAHKLLNSNDKPIQANIQVVALK